MNKYKVYLSGFNTKDRCWVVNATHYKMHGKFIEFFDEIYGEDAKISFNKDYVILIDKEK